MNVAITGADGFIGKNLVEYLTHHLPDLKLRLIDRVTYNSDKLFDKIRDSQFLIHCAGINRGDKVYEENIKLQKTLLTAIEKVNFNGTLLNLSSVHAERETEYGIVKREMERIFSTDSTSNNYKVLSFRLPNVYGPYSRENYNTVVATFVFNELFQLRSQVNPGIIDLIYVKNACKVIGDTIVNGVGNDCIQYIQPDISIEISALYSKISDLVASTAGSKMELKTDLDKNLFRTITYFRLTNGLLQSTLTSFSDDRGWFSELLHLNGLGQVSVSRTVAETPRGNHYHTRKLERFIVISGEAEVELIGFNNDKWKFYLKPLSFLDIPNYYIHTLGKVNSQDLICAFWVDEYFDTNNSDTFYL